jgi:sugar/nucleoside kinase (ribokinase family)
VRDINTVAGVLHAPRPGGAAYYATMLYARLGLHTAVLTKVAPDDLPILTEELRTAGVTIYNRPTDRTTTFRNVYAPDDADQRIQRVDRRADRLRIADLPAIQARAWQIGPLTDRDIDLAILVRCAGSGGIVAMDLQGLTRRIVAGEVHASGTAKGARHLRHVDVLKADEDEILAYTGEPTVDEAAAWVQRAGVSEVLVTSGTRGSILYAGGERRAIDAVPPRRLVDATGCGDTYLAAYVARRLAGAEPLDCARFAAVAASLNIESTGAFRGNADDIAERLTSLA